jgi:hypothetical protein
MPEEFPGDPHPDTQLDQPPNTYGAVLAGFPDMHPDLRAHVERLALESGELLALSEGDTDRPTPTADTPHGRGMVSTGLMPLVETSHEATVTVLPESHPEVVQALQEEPKEISPMEAQLQRLHDTRQTYQKLVAELSLAAADGDNAVANRRIEAAQTALLNDFYNTLVAPQVSSPDEYQITEVSELIEEVLETVAVGEQEGLLGRNGDYSLRSLTLSIPTDRFREGYNSPDSRIREPFERLLHTMAISGNRSEIRHAGEKLATVYGIEPGELFNTGKVRHDPLAAEIVRRPTFANDLVLRKLQERESGESNAEHKIRVWDAAYDLLSQAGLPAKINHDFQRGAQERSMKAKTSENPDPEVKVVDLRTRISKVLKNTAHVGPENLEKVWNKAGITNFDNYDANQLKRMVDFIDSDEILLDRLKAGDTTVVFTDAMGDYNGALSDASTLYEGSAENTLFFEVSEPGDFYRYLTLLKERGVKPSVMAVVAHGDKNGLWFGKAHEDDFLITHKSAKDAERLAEVDARRAPGSKKAAMRSIFDLKALPRIAKEYMQPSKGIYDNRSMIGRKTVILDSCMQAEAAAEPLWNPRTWRMPADTGREHGLGRRKSTAQTLIAGFNDPSLTLYASAHESRSMRTDRGTRVLKILRNKKGKPIASSTAPVIGHRLGGDGRVVTEEVDEIILRPPSNRAA